MPKQNLREKTMPTRSDPATGRGHIAIGPGPKMQKIRENKQKKRLGRDQDKQVSPELRKYAYFLLPASKKYHKIGGNRMPACKKTYKIAEISGFLQKSYKKPQVFSMPKQKMREKTIRAPSDTATGRGRIAIGPGPKMQKIGENE